MTNRKIPSTAKPKARRPRDPFWRVRRALGAQRVESGKAYSRAKDRRAARRAREEADG